MTRLPAEIVHVADIIGAHGVRGALKILCLTEDPLTVVTLNPMLDNSGSRLFDIERVGAFNGGLIVKASGIATRNEAEALRGTLLFALRNRLPAPEADEFFATDLVGLTAFDVAGRTFGKVRAVVDYGAGDILDIDTADGSNLMVPFTTRSVPVVDLDAGRLTIEPPIEVEIGE